MMFAKSIVREGAKLVKQLMIKLYAKTCTIVALTIVMNMTSIMFKTANKILRLCIKTQILMLTLIRLMSEV